MKRCSCFLQRGLTLLELSVVLLVLIALAGLTVPYVVGTGQMAMCQATDATMHTVKEAIMGGSAGPGYYMDTLGRYPSPKDAPDEYSLHHLFVKEGWDKFNPQTGVGWRGPYLMSGATISVRDEVGNKSHFITYAYAHAMVNGQYGVNDAWGRPLVLQVPNQTTCNTLTDRDDTRPGECARLVSAGPGNGIGPDDADIDTKIDDPNTDAPSARRTNDDRMLYLKIPMPKKDENPSCLDR